MTDNILSILCVVVGIFVMFLSYKLGYAQGRLDEYNGKEE